MATRAPLPELLSKFGTSTVGAGARMTPMSGHYSPAVAAVHRPPTHADAIAEFETAAAQHPEWNIDMDAVLEAVRYVRSESA